MRVLALRLDYRKYARFKRPTAPVHRYAGGRVRIVTSARESAPTREDLLLCLDFVDEFDDSRVQVR